MPRGLLWSGVAGQPTAESGRHPSRRRARMPTRLPRNVWRVAEQLDVGHEYLERLRRRLRAGGWGARMFPAAPFKFATGSAPYMSPGPRWQACKARPD